MLWGVGAASCLFLGGLANLTPNKEELGQPVEAVIFAAFFTLVGIHLDFSLVVPCHRPD